MCCFPLFLCDFMYECLCIFFNHYSMGFWPANIHSLAQFHVIFQFFGKNNHLFPYTIYVKYQFSYLCACWMRDNAGFAKKSATFVTCYPALWHLTHYFSHLCLRVAFWRKKNMAKMIWIMDFLALNFFLRNVRCVYFSRCSYFLFNEKKNV